MMTVRILLFAGRLICRRCAKRTPHMTARTCQLCRLYQWGKLIRYIGDGMNLRQAFRASEKEADYVAAQHDHSYETNHIGNGRRQAP